MEAVRVLGEILALARSRAVNSANSLLPRSSLPHLCSQRSWFPSSKQMFLHSIIASKNRTIFAHSPRHDQYNRPEKYNTHAHR